MTVELVCIRIVSDEAAANIYVHLSGVVVLNAVLRLLSSVQRETIP